MTTVASGRWTSAPALVDSAIGRKPRASVVAVISTGRSRSFAPPEDGLVRPAPVRRRSLDVADQHHAVHHRDAEQRDEPHARRDRERHAPQPQGEDPAVAAIGTVR